MSDSTINNSGVLLPSGANYASSSPTGSWSNGLSSTQGTGAKTANPEKLALAFLSRMSEVGSTNYGGARGVQGANGVQATQGTQAGSGVRFSGQTLTATMPPPAAPRVQVNANTQAAFQSFAAESKAAMSNVGQWTAQQPALSQSTGSTLIQPGSTTVDQVAGDAANWLSTAGMGTSAIANGGLAAFMKLRVENTDSAINAMQNLASSTSDLQSTMSEQQADAAQAAQDEAQKAQKKSGILGVFQKIFAVVMAVVCTVAAFFTADPALAALGIVGASAAFSAGAIGATAAVGAFVVAGAVKGKGKGFDFWGGLSWYTNVVGLVGMAAVLKSVAKASMDAAVKGFETAVGKTAQETTESGSKSLLENLGKDGIGSASQDAGEDSAQAVKDASTQGATAAAFDTAKGGVSDGMLTEESSQEMAERAERKGFSKMYQQLKQGISASLLTMTGGSKQFAAVAQGAGTGVTTEAGTAVVKDAGSGALEEGDADATQAAADQVVKEAGSKLAIAGAGVGVMEGADQLGQSIIQLHVSLDQADSDADMAQFSQLKAMVKMLDTSYKTANDLVQTLVKSHSNAVDTAQSMLKNNNDAMNMIAGNMSQI